MMEVIIERTVDRGPLRSVLVVEPSKMMSRYSFCSATRKRGHQSHLSLRTTARVETPIWRGSSCLGLEGLGSLGLA